MAQDRVRERERKRERERERERVCSRGEYGAGLARTREKYLRHTHTGLPPYVL